LNTDFQSKFLLSLKKHLLNSILINIRQESFDRIVYFDFEKRFLFGAYGKSTFISDLKRYKLDFKTLKNCMQEDEKDLIENIRKVYFEIGIGDN